MVNPYAIVSFLDALWLRLLYFISHLDQTYHVHLLSSRHHARCREQKDKQHAVLTREESVTHTGHRHDGEKQYRYDTLHRLVLWGLRPAAAHLRVSAQSERTRQTHLRHRFLRAFLITCLQLKRTSLFSEPPCVHAKLSQSCPTSATIWTVVPQAPPPMGFSRWEYWAPTTSYLYRFSNIYTQIGRWERVEAFRCQESFFSSISVT